MDVAREFPPGHIGTSPQHPDTTVGRARVAGMLADFQEHYPPKPRVDAYLLLPPLAQAIVPGYYRDETESERIDAAAWLLDLAPNNQNPKAIGGPNLYGDV